jgi:hypothetical protein
MPICTDVSGRRTASFNHPCAPRQGHESLQWNSLGGEVTVGAITVTAQANELPDRHDTQGSGDFYLATNGDI